MCWLLIRFNSQIPFKLDLDGQTVLSSGCLTHSVDSPHLIATNLWHTLCRFKRTIVQLKQMNEKKKCLMYLLLYMDLCSCLRSILKIPPISYLLFFVYSCVYIWRGSVFLRLLCLFCFLWFKLKDFSSAGGEMKWISPPPHADRSQELLSRQGLVSLERKCVSLEL